MKIGCSSWSFREAFGNRKLDLLSFVELAAELGLDGIEPLASAFPSVGDRFLQELRARLARFPVEISAVSLANDFARPDESERRWQCDDVVAWTFVCRDLGVGILRTFTGRLHEGIDRRRAKAWVYECYERVLPAAERAGVTLAVENHSDVCRLPEELVELILHFGSSSLQANPDPTNFLPVHAEKEESQREVIYSSLAKVARFAVHSHLQIRDFDGAGRPTNVDVARLLEVYRGACYDGYISLEYFGEGDAVDAVRRAVAFLRGLIDTG